jgi:hypothetical protein
MPIYFDGHYLLKSKLIHPNTLLEIETVEPEAKPTSKAHTISTKNVKKQSQDKGNFPIKRMLSHVATSGGQETFDRLLDKKSSHPSLPRRAIAFPRTCPALPCNYRFALAGGVDRPPP